MDWLIDPQAWIAFATLVTLELVLGVDNVIFISILAGKLPAQQQGRARTIALIAGAAGLLLPDDLIEFEMPAGWTGRLSVSAESRCFAEQARANGE
jgi:hypothetical protein